MAEKRVTQIFGTMYTVFKTKCNPRLWEETFRDETHVRHEMETEAVGGLTGWNFPATDDNVKAIVDYCVAAWEVIGLARRCRR